MTSLRLCGKRPSPRVLRVRRRCVGTGELEDEGVDCGDELGGGIIITACRRFDPVTGRGTFSTKGKDTPVGTCTWKSVCGMGGARTVDVAGLNCGRVRVNLRGTEDRGGEQGPAVTRDDGGGDGDGLCAGALGRWEPLALGAEEWLPLSRSSSSSSSSSLDRMASSRASTQSMTLPIVIPAS